MTSAICTVNGGSATNGVNVSAGSTVTIQLADLTGVGSWSVTCVGSDELQVPATITSGLSINNTTKTAIYTAPSTATGSSLIFQIQVNGGRDLNGVVNTLYTTTLEVFVLNPFGYRLLATGETIEGSSNYGWIATINSFLRATTQGPTGPQGIQGSSVYTLASQATAGLVNMPAGDLQGTGSSATNPKISKLSGDASGMINIPTGVGFKSPATIAMDAQAWFYGNNFRSVYTPSVQFDPNGNAAFGLTVQKAGLTGTVSAATVALTNGSNSNTVSINAATGSPSSNQNYYFPAAAGVSGSNLSTDTSGNLYWQPAPPSPTGVFVASGTVGVSGIQGPQQGIVNYFQAGVTGYTGSRVGSPENITEGTSFLVNWNKPTLQFGSISQATSLGTGSSWIQVNAAGLYEVSYNMVATGKFADTGIAGNALFQVQQSINATGTIGGGTPISQSFQMLTSYAAANTSYTDPLIATKSYMVALPSGCSIETWITPVNILNVHNAATGLMLSATGTSFSIKQIG